MAIINFTVNYDQLASQADGGDGGTDADVIALIGDVTFTPQFSDNRPALGSNYSPRPAGFKVLPFTGFIDTDGRLKSAKSGTVGVRLWANDPVLELNKLIYKVEFKLRTPLGEPVWVDGGYFEAPSTDITVNLTDVLQPTAAAVNGLLRQSGYAEDIIDSGALGRDVVRSENETEFWDLFGTVPPANLPSYVDDVLEYNNQAAFPAMGETGKIYVAKDNNDSFRWTGSAYIRISDRILSTGITDSTSVGRSLVTAASQQAARSAISAQRNAVFDVRDYGAVGDGTTDDTAAIQAAIDAAGAWEVTGPTWRGGAIVKFPYGCFKISDALQFNNWQGNVTLQGVSCGTASLDPSVKDGTTLFQSNSAKNAIKVINSQNIAIEKMKILGPASGSANGVHIGFTSNTNMLGFHMRNVIVTKFGGDGIYADTLLMSHFEYVISTQNSGHGFNLNNCVALTFNSCWSNTNGGNGWNLNGINSSSWNAGYAERNSAKGWYIYGGAYNLTFNACTSEQDEGNSWEFNGCRSTVLNGAQSLGNHGIGFYVRGTSYGVQLSNVLESAGPGATYGIKTESPAITVVLNYGCDSAVNFNGYIDNVLSTSSASYTLAGASTKSGLVVGAPTFYDTTTNTSRRAKFDMSAISNSTTRTITVPNKDLTLQAEIVDNSDGTATA